MVRGYVMDRRYCGDLSSLIPFQLVIAVVRQKVFHVIKLDFFSHIGYLKLMQAQAP